MCQGPQGRLSALGDSGPFPRARMVNQLSRATCACVQGPAESTSCSVRHRLLNEGRQCRPVVPGDSGPGPRAHGVDQLSRVSWALVRVPTFSKKGHRRLGPRSEGLRVDQLFQADSGPCASARGVDQLPRMTCSRFRGTAVPPGVPGDLVQGPRAHAFYFLPRTTRVRVQGPPGSTTPSGRHAPMSEGLWPRPHNPGYQRPVTSAHGIDQLCLETRARERRPLVLTSFAR